MTTTDTLAYSPLFDCFVRILRAVPLLDGETGYIVENKYEGIENYLMRDYELYGRIITIQ